MAILFNQGMYDNGQTTVRWAATDTWTTGSSTIVSSFEQTVGTTIRGCTVTVNGVSLTGRIPLTAVPGIYQIRVYYADNPSWVGVAYGQSYSIAVTVQTDAGDFSHTASVQCLQLPTAYDPIDGTEGVPPFNIVLTVTGAVADTYKFVVSGVTSSGQQASNSFTFTAPQYGHTYQWHVVIYSNVSGSVTGPNVALTTGIKLSGTVATPNSTTITIDSVDYTTAQYAAGVYVAVPFTGTVVPTDAVSGRVFTPTSYSYSGVTTNQVGNFALSASPNAVSSPLPPDGATNVSELQPVLKWKFSNVANINVLSAVMIDDETGFWEWLDLPNTGSPMSVDITSVGLRPGHTYTWIAWPTDLWGNGGESGVYTFSVVSSSEGVLYTEYAPDKATNPTPANTATGVSVRSTMLSWE